MARKRGGLAGLYDRNKGLIRTASTIGASLLGGPGAGAAVNAAFRGFDRPGQRGIGFDLGQGAQGAVEGYGIGSMTKSAQSGLGRLFGARGAAAGGGLPAELPGMDMTPRLTPGMTRSSVGGMDLTGGPSMAARPVGSMAAPVTRAAPPARSRVRSAASAVGTGVQKAAKFAQENPKAVEMALGQLPSAANEVAERGVAVQEARQALEQQQFDELMRRQRMQEEREALIAQLFSPLLQSRLSERNASMPPTSLGGYLRMNDFPEDTMPVTSPRAPAPMRSSVSPVRGGVAPVRSGVSPVSRLR
jgi:hypothetical protein